MLEKEASQRQRLSNGRGKKGAKKCATFSKNGNGKASEAAARITRTNSRYVEMMKAVAKAAPELVEKIRAGSLGVPEAKTLSELPLEERRKPSYNCSHHFDTLGQPNDIETPPPICQFLFDIISPKYDVRRILDPCAGNGNLTKPWKRRKVITFEIKTGEDFFDSPDRIKCDLVLCNPPFSGDNGGAKKNLVPLFLKRILEITPPKTPIVLFTPMTFRLGLNRKSSRLRWLRDDCPAITSIISLPRDAFPGIEYHCEILLFNMRRLKSHYFLPDQCLAGRS
jgi:type I restriction enzyme M protein